VNRELNALTFNFKLEILLLVFLVTLIIMSYLMFIAFLKRGWRIAAQRKPLPVTQFNSITVIIPVRNEATSITVLLQQLQAIDYPDFEVIVVDDHSEDQTKALISVFSSKDKRIRLITNEGTGKKQAITTGIDQAKGAVIVTTDGDCQVQQGWLHSINQHFQDAGTMMVFGGVSIQTHSFFSALQALEFSSLIGSGVALWALGKPVMCNGANLAFRREVFQQVGGYAGNEHIASGDDEFLMRKILQRYPDGVSFLNQREGNVQTKAARDVRSFIQQRFRWAGKWKYNQSIFARTLAIYILIVQLAVIASLVLLFVEQETWIRVILLLLLVTRFAAEAFFLFPVCRFFNTRWHWGAFLVLQFIYPVYVVGTGLFSNLIAVKWKDRTIKL
jgi:biofilm PGA synthesis N-glycosyltransferase PgaC